MAVRMTERAAEEFRTLCSSKSLPVETTQLRVDAEPAEEEGKLSISLMFDRQAPLQDDVVEDTGGAKLVINKRLAETLGDVRIDFKDERGGGFVLERVQ